MAKNYRNRKEWQGIIKDKTENNLTVIQVTKMYDVSSASVYKWVSIFKQELAAMPKNEDDVMLFMRSSLDDLNNEFSDNVLAVMALEKRQNVITASMSRLERSLEFLQQTEAETE